MLIAGLEDVSVIGITQIDSEGNGLIDGMEGWVDGWSNASAHVCVCRGGGGG